jgi:hypothetical protein
VTLQATDNDGSESPARKVTTDEKGNYQFANVPAGAYRIAPVSQAYVVNDPPSVSPMYGPRAQQGKSVIIGERETVSNIDFALVRGGVITGKVTDGDGKPLVEQPVNIAPASPANKGAQQQQYAELFRTAYTDDRGVYRGFGLLKGRYVVSVGQRQDTPIARALKRSIYRLTFHPSVEDASKATVIEVSEGSEAANVDITVNTGPAVDTYSISGRIVNGTNDEPISGMVLGIQTSGSSIASIQWQSDRNGQFRIENLLPGKYSVYMEPQMSRAFRFNPVPVEIVDKDVTGLIVKAVAGATINGVIVVEGGALKTAATRQLSLQTSLQKQGSSDTVVKWGTVNADGSFQVSGLEAGTAIFWVGSNLEQNMPFKVVRIEREGMVQPRGIELKDGETVAGVTVFVRYGSGSIRGVVKFENGEQIIAPAQLELWITDPTAEPGNPVGTLSTAPQIDSRGLFVFEKLPAGTYEVNASVVGSRGRISTKQPVTVTDGAVTEVTLTLNLKPN